MSEQKAQMPIMLAFFDILGTSKLIENQRTSKVYEIYQYVTELMKKLHGGIDIGAAPDGEDGFCAVLFHQDIHFAHFSDTFILWSRIDAGPIILTADSYRKDFTEPFLQINFPRFPTFLSACMNVFCEALSGGVPLRGCISIGDSIMDEENGQFVGEALTESAKGEQTQKWIGFSFGKSFFRLPCYDCRTFIPYTRHIKMGYEDTISQIAIDWPRYWREHKTDIDITTILRDMNDNPEFSDYYTNALDFVEFSNNNERWWTEINIQNIKNSDVLDKEITTWVSRLSAK
jgi:hypothetical protein